jgi:hypothetical protein
VEHLTSKAKSSSLDLNLRIMEEFFKAIKNLRQMGGMELSRQ